jgi:hypothetical protein
MTKYRSCNFGVLVASVLRRRFFNLDQTSDGWSLHAVDGLLTNKKIILLFYFYLMTKPDMHISNKFYFLLFWKKNNNEKISEISVRKIQSSD